MIKVAMIGAGSVVFSKNLTGDILSFPEFRNATLAYMDIDRDRLDVGAALCGKVGKALDANPTIEAHTDRRKALDGADFVINMVQIGGFDSTLVDFEIPRKYGLNFTIADTTGPGGFFRALRTFGLLKGLCRDMMEVCPRAVLLNYSNPMSMNMRTIAATSDVRAVGLCHSVQGTFARIMSNIDENGDDPRLNFICAGINHMAFYLRLEKEGVDLYPRLFRAMNDPAIFKTNAVRYELMRRLGYFITESSEHNAEYNPWFIPRGREVIERFNVPIDEYLRRCDGIVDEFERMKTFAFSDEPIKVNRSHEYGSTIIHSMATGKLSVVYGNMPNHGAISNLPNDAIAEAPTLVDRNGLQFTTVGALPPQLIGYMQPHVTQHELFIRAAIEGRRDHVYQAAMFDPLTAATLSTDQIVDMCDELIAAHGFEKDGGNLPDLDATPTRVPTSGKTFDPVSGSSLRESWTKAQRQATAEYVMECHVLGPFAAGAPGDMSLEFATPFEAAFCQRRDGLVDLSAAYTSGGERVVWKLAAANKRGYINFEKAIARMEFCVGYAYLEHDENHGREAIMRIGSDDGIKIWLNGEMVHDNDTQRGFAIDSDRATIHLKAGKNRFLIKVVNYHSGWGFGIAIPRATS